MHTDERERLLRRLFDEASTMYTSKLRRGQSDPPLRDPSSAWTHVHVCVRDRSRTRTVLTFTWRTNAFWTVHATDEGDEAEAEDQSLPTDLNGKDEVTRMPYAAPCADKLQALMRAYKPAKGRTARSAKLVNVLRMLQETPVDRIVLRLGSWSMAFPRMTFRVSGERTLHSGK